MSSSMQRMTPLVSIVMPCLNSAEHVSASVASALAQSMCDFELLVVDNGSTDSTIAIIEAIGDARIKILRQPNPGVSAARNMGIEAARGECIAFLDSDDTWSRDCLAKLHAALAARPEAVLAYCGWQKIGLPGRRGEPFVPPDYEVPDKRALLFTGCRWPIHAALVRRDAVLAAGSFDTSLKNAEDFALWLEVAGTRPIVRVPEVLAYYHFHGGEQASQNRALEALNQLAAQKRYLAAHPDFQAELGQGRSRDIILTGLLDRGFECYWKRDLDAARVIFREALKFGHRSPKDWKYLLPALLPLSLHKLLLNLWQRLRQEAPSR